MKTEQKTDFIYLSLPHLNDSGSGFFFHLSCFADRILRLNIAITVIVRYILSLVGVVVVVAVAVVVVVVAVVCCCCCCL